MIKPGQTSVRTGGLPSSVPLRNHSDHSCSLRAELGLPEQVPVVMTGHQAEWWHPGIVAKFIGAQHIAQANSGVAAWIVPDQDHSDPWGWQAPEADSAGIPTITHHRLAPPLPPETMIAGCPSITTSGESEPARALLRHSHHGSAVSQWMHALREMLMPSVQLGAALRASQFARTQVFQHLVEQMRCDPHRVALSYNRALRAAPGASLRELHVGVDPGAVELPLWYATETGRRGRVFAGDLDQISPADLLPRALTMTGVLRAWACDHFVHGIGGMRYDRATEAWFGEWLGVELAPCSMITADATLDLGIPPVDADEVAHARWLAHHARHNPSVYQDTDSARQKAGLLKAITTAPRRSPERSRAYRQMHDLLALSRSSFEGSIRAFENRAEREAALLGAQELRTKRGWPWFLYPGEQKREIIRQVERAVSEATVQR